MTSIDRNGIRAHKAGCPGASWCVLSSIAAALLPLSPTLERVAHVLPANSRVTDGARTPLLPIACSLLT